MNSIKLSIIIPVYNVEKYIGKCLESVFPDNIDISKYEVIIVNDGTTDNSLSIIKPFLESKSNCFLIEQSNKGLSVARNEGLKKAHGEYVWFVDSDDTVNSEFLLSFIDNRSENKWDIIGYNMQTITENNNNVDEDKIIYHEKYEATYNNLLPWYKAPGRIKTTPTQRFIYRRQFLIDNELFFLPGVYHEDIDFGAKFLCCSPTIYIEDKSNYNYLIRKSGSITSTFNIKRIYDLCKIIEDIKQFGFDKKLSKDKWQVIYSNIFDVSLAIYSKGDFKKKEYVDFIKSNRAKIVRITTKAFFNSVRYNTLKRTGKFIISLFSPRTINMIG